MAEQLINYVNLGNLSAVEEQINSGVPVDIQDSEGTTPLQVAAVNGCDEIVSFLLSKSASVDLPNAYGWTPLMLAAKHGHLSTILLLLENKAKVNVFNKLGLTPIAAAAASGQLAAVKILMEAGSVFDSTPVGVITQLESDLTPLMISAYIGCEAILDYVLEKEACASHISATTGWTPLMLAACGGHLQCVQNLLASGADPSVTDISGLTALDIALARGHHEVRAHLESVTALGSSSVLPKMKEMLEAAKAGDVRKIKLVLMSDPYCVDRIDPDEGLTALMLAAKYGNIDVIQFLLRFKASMDIQDSVDGWTALMHAVFHGHVDIVKLLLERGADVSALAKGGYTAIDLARYTDNSENKILNLLSNVSYPSSHLQSFIIEKYGNSVMMASSVPEDSANSSFVSVRPKSKKSPKKSMLMSSFRNSCGSSKKENSCEAGMSSSCSLQSSRLKGLVGAVTFRLQSTLLPKKADKSSDWGSVCSGNSPSQFDQTSDDVFEKNDASERSIVCECLTKEPKPMLCVSSLKSPNKYLADRLKLNAMEPVHPPLLSSMSEKDEDLEAMLKNLKNSSGSICLKTPNLLRSCANEINQMMAQNDISGLRTLSKGSGKTVKFEDESPVSPSPVFSLPPLQSCSLWEESLSSSSAYTDQLKVSSQSTPIDTENIRDASQPTKSANIKFQDEASVNVYQPNKCPSSTTFPKSALKCNESKKSPSLLGYVKAPTARRSVLKKDISGLKNDSAECCSGTKNDIGEILKEKSLEKHADKFRDQEVDAEALQYFTEEDLKELGINTMTSRVKLLEIVEQLKKS